LKLPGDVDFHHNLITNMNDDAIYIDQKKGNTLKVHHNVFTRCLTCFSYIGKASAPLQGGPWYIYRNLIDLRQPTASFRPFHPDAQNEEGEREVFRHGWLHKSNGPSGNYHIFQNTILALNEKGPHAYFTHLYPKGTPLKPRTAFNNIFVGINHSATLRKPVVMLPSPGFKDIIDGNLYYRLGTDTHPAFQCLEFNEDDKYAPGHKFATLKAYYASTLFTESQVHYPPGFERNSFYKLPKFRNMTDYKLSSPFPFEDLRLAAGSPAIGKGLSFSDMPVLVALLKKYDRVLPGSHRDIGCYSFNAPPLKVGVGERHSYPKIMILT
ncbi:MAG: hypothetical protein ABI760_24780, partial [Ferruginibacter sp.]